MKADNVLATIGNTPHIRLARHVPRPRGLGEERARQSRRLDQGPHRAGDGRGRREVDGALQARRHDHRADQRQHRHRPRHGRGGQGLQAGAGHARIDVARAAPADAGLRRDFRPHARGKGHEGRARAGAGAGRRRPTARGCRSSSRTRPTSRSTPAPPRRRSSPTSPTRPLDVLDHRRRHRRPPDRLRRGAQEGLAGAQGLCGRADAVAGHLAAASPARTRSRASARASSPPTSTPRRSTARSRSIPRTPRKWPAAAPARKGCWSASARGATLAAIQQKLAELPAGRAGARLQLRHRRALPVGAGLPADGVMRTRAALDRTCDGDTRAHRPGSPGPPARRAPRSWSSRRS